MKNDNDNGLHLKYFVLNPNKKDEHGSASRIAIKAYAKAIDKINSELARDLEYWIIDIEAKIRNEEIIRRLDSGEIEPFDSGDGYER